MIKLIFFKELTEFWREGKIRWAFLITVLLLLTSVFTSYQNFTKFESEQVSAKKSERNIWLNQNEKNPHSAAHYGSYVFKLRTPLSIIDPGLNKYTGISIFLEAHKRNTSQYMSAADQSGLVRFGELSPDFILLYLVPLIIILLGYNSFSREYESSTIKLLKSQGIPINTIILGKWLSIFFISMVILITCSLTVIVSFISFSSSQALDNASYIVFFVIYAIYYGVLINLILFISLYSKISSRSLVMSIAIWIMIGFVTPKIGSNVANYLYPYPSKQTFNHEVAEDKKNGLDGHNPWNEEAKKLEKETLEKYGVDSLHKLPFNYAGFRMQKGEEHEASIYYKHYLTLKSISGKQNDVYTKASIFSPFIPARFLSMGLARTDYHNQWQFADKAEKHRIAMVAALNNDLAKNSEYGDWSYKADQKLWASIPKFEYDYQSLGEVITNNNYNFISLLLWLAFSTFILISQGRKA